MQFKNRQLKKRKLRVHLKEQKEKQKFYMKGRKEEGGFL